MHRTFLRNVSKKFPYFTSLYSTSKNPITRTLNALRGDVGITQNETTYPEHADIVIIGGGYIGSSTAFWLKKRAGEGLSIVILDKDLTFRGAQNLYSFDSVTRHFSLPENILLSEYGTEFLRNVKYELGENININYAPHDYLLLASEDYAEKLVKNVELQREQGVINKLISVEEIQSKYPWINTTDIKLGCTSTEKEGSFNSYALLKGLQKKSKELGTSYVEAEVTGFEMTIQQDVLIEGVAPGSFKKVNNLKYRTKGNEEYSIKFAICVIAAGANSSNIAKLASIGIGDGLLKVPLPIEKREFKVYCINDTKTKLKLNTPYIMDTSGLWIRKNGLHNNFICSQLPPLKQETNLSQDEYYNSIFRPCFLNRFPDYKNAEVHPLSNEMYDCNTYDDTGLLGPHAYHNNIIIASGFGRHGVQHAPGVGRAISELIIDGQYSSIDLTRFGFDRLLMDEPLVDFNIY